MDNLILRIRRKPTEPWTQNHHLGGWKVRNSSNTWWINMHPKNTFLANPEFNPKQLPDEINNPKWLKV